MKNIFFLACLVFVGTISAQDFRAKAPAAGPAPKIQVGKYEQFKLANGLKVIVVENHKLPRLSVQLFVDIDPILEGENAGYVTMAGDMISRGTKTRTKAQFDEQIDFIGATFNSSSDGLFGASLKKHAAKLLELMADVTLNPTFPAEEFEKVKTQQVSGLQSNKDNADFIAGQVGNVLNFGASHPFGEVMTEQSLEKATVTMAQNFYNTYFRPEISYLIVVGDVNKAEVEGWAKQYFGAWKNTTPMPKTSFGNPTLPETASLDFVNKQGAVQSVINITYPIAYSNALPDYLPARVMNYALGGYFRSRINNNLREAKAYTYGARSALRANKWVGTFGTSGSYRNEVTDSALVQLLIEINKMRTETIGDEELSMVKNVMSGDFARSLEEPQTVATFALNIARFGLAPDYYDTYLQRVAAVTPADVLAMGKKYLHPDKAHILVVGNKGAIAEKMRALSPNGKINYYDLYGKPLQDAASALPPGLTADNVLEDYIVAIGAANARQVSTLQSEGSISVQGMNLTMNSAKEDGKRYAMTMKMGAATMQKQVLSGGAGYSEARGKKEVATGTALNDLVTASYVFPELHLTEMGAKPTLKGIEMVNGAKTYQVDFTFSNGKTASYFYDATTGLQARAIETQGEGEEATNITTDYADYREVNGVKLPYKITLIGAAPMPLEMIIKEYKVNEKLDDALFK